LRSKGVSRGGNVTKKVCAPGLIVLLSAICLTSITSAQTCWWRTYGGADDDWGSEVQPTADGGYVIAGQTWSFGAGENDVYLVKIDSQGDTLWTRTHGGAGIDEGNSVQQTTDGGYVAAGWTSSFGAGAADVYLIRTNASGDTLWTRTYGGTGSDIGNSVQQTADSGYIIAGYTYSFGAGNDDVYLIKTNASGDTLWTRTFGGTGSDEGFSVQQTSDSGYIITGFTRSFGAGEEDAYLIKTNSRGTTLWTRTYGGPHLDIGYSVRQTADGGYVVAGGFHPFGAGNEAARLIRTSAVGDTLWTRTYGGADDDWGWSVEQTNDGGYIVAGGTYSFGAGSQDVYLVKTDSQGDTLWTRAYGGTDGDRAYSVRQTSDGGYIIAGYTMSFGAGGDVYLIKTDANGNVAGIEEPVAGHPVNPTRFLVQPNPFSSVARVPGHETDLFVLSDVTGRHVAVCKGDRIGEGLRPGVYFLSPVGSKAGKTVTATIIKAAF
jgi:hypothetical protein